MERNYESSPLILTAPFVLVNGLIAENPTSHLSII